MHGWSLLPRTPCLHCTWGGHSPPPFGFGNQMENWTPRSNLQVSIQYPPRSLPGGPRSHSTPRLNHVQKVMKIWWTWSKVVIFGQFWFGRALYGVWPSAAVPLLKHCLSTANHVQPRVRLKKGSHVFERGKKAASYHG